MQSQETDFEFWDYLLFGVMGIGVTIMILTDSLSQFYFPSLTIAYSGVFLLAIRKIIRELKAKNNSCYIKTGNVLGYI